MKILFLTTILPVRAKSGGEIVSRLFIDKLSSLGYYIDVLGYLRRNDNISDIPTNMYLVKKIVIESKSSKLFVLLNIVKSYLYGRCYSTQKYITKEYIKLLKRQIEQNTYSFIVIDHFQMGWVLKYLPKNINIVAVAHNVESDLYKQLYEENSNRFPLSCLYKREMQLMRLLEKQILVLSKQIWLLTQNNIKRYIELYSLNRSEKLKHICIPAITNLNSEITANQAKNIECDIGIIGTWTWNANNKGLIWFFEKIYPFLPVSLSIRVAGMGADWLCNKYKNVRYVGFVENADKFMENSDVVAIPSITGDGVQIKTIQTIALGQKIVATSFALRGIDIFPSYVASADTPADFCEKLIYMLASVYPESHNEAVRWNENRNKQFSNDMEKSVKALNQNLHFDI